MLSYSKTIEKLSEMKGRYDDGFSSSDRIFIRDLYELLFGVPIKNTGCSSCYQDAYILIFTKLKKDKTMPKEKKFILTNGVLLHAFNGDVYTNANLTDEIAMDAINENPNRTELFAKLPDNYEQLCAARKAVKEKEDMEKSNKSSEELLSDVANLKSALATAQEDLKDALSKNDELEGKVSELNEKIAKSETTEKELEGKVSELSAANELLNSENTALSEAKESLVNDNQSLADELTALKKNLDEAQKASNEDSTSKKAAKAKAEGDSEQQ